ncbi:MAG: tetratricopeptide repeat protein [Flavobacterium sp.]|nr:MAG: tetratricopeptide repeat protein [Flavobacterium sp.]
MSKLFSLLFTFLVCTILHAQTRHAIDSINNIPFETKIEKAASLDRVFLKNVADARKIKYKMGEAESYSNLGLVYYYQGKYDENVFYILKAIALFEAIGAIEKQSAEYGGLGYSMKRRNMDKALYYMQKGKSIAETNQLQLPLLSIYNNYGVLKEMLNELDSALYFYQKGLVVKESIHDSLGIPYSLNNIAGIYVMKGKYAAARKMYDQALKIRQIRNDRIGIAENNQYFGDLYFTMKDYKRAIGYYKTSLDMALKYKYTLLAQDNFKSLADSYEILGNPVKAYENYKMFAKYKDSLVNKDTNAKIAELEIGFDTNKKEKLLEQNKNLLLKKESEAYKKNILLAAVSLLAIFAVLISILIYRQQRLNHEQLHQEHELKAAIARIESQNTLQNQRLSISRDLHDNIGAQLTFIISSVDNIKYAFDLSNTKLDHKLSSISNFAKDTIVELRDTIWAMNSTALSIADLQSRIMNFIEKAQESQPGISFLCNVDRAAADVKLTSVQGMNLYRSVQEAVNNAIKHSLATEIAIAFSVEDQKVHITVSDNGRGFDTVKRAEGNGLTNIEKRLREIGGTFRVESEPDKGTTIVLECVATNKTITV